MTGNGRVIRPSKEGLLRPPLRIQADDGAGASGMAEDGDTEAISLCLPLPMIVVAIAV